MTQHAYTNLRQLQVASIQNSMFRHFAWLILFISTSYQMLSAIIGQLIVLMPAEL